MTLSPKYTAKKDLVDIPLWNVGRDKTMSSTKPTICGIHLAMMIVVNKTEYFFNKKE